MFLPGARRRVTPEAKAECADGRHTAHIWLPASVVQGRHQSLWPLQHHISLPPPPCSLQASAGPGFGSPYRMPHVLLRNEVRHQRALAAFKAVAAAAAAMARGLRRRRICPLRCCERRRRRTASERGEPLSVLFGPHVRAPAPRKLSGPREVCRSGELFQAKCQGFHRRGIVFAGRLGERMMGA